MLKKSFFCVEETQINTNEILLVENKQGETAFHRAVRMDYVLILKKIFFWVEEAKIYPNYLKKNLLLGKDN